MPFRVLLLLLPCALAVAAPAPRPATDPVAAVRDMEKEFRKTLPPGPGRPALERISGERIAWDDASRSCLGEGFGRLSPADRKAVVASFRALVEETWIPLLLRTDPLYAFAVFGSTTSGTEAQVRTRAQWGGSQPAIDFRLLRGKDGRWRILGVSVNGADVLATWRGELPALLEAHGPQGLVATLDARRKALQDLRKAGRAP